MKRIIRLSASVILIFVVWFSISAVTGIVVKAVKTEFLYLVVGLDDAAENADSIIFVAYDSKRNRATVAQLPRDTYCRYGNGYNKINGIYSELRYEGNSPNSAMSTTSDFIAKQFGISFDGYFAVTTEAFRNIVDSIGGVDITMPYEYVFHCGDGKDVTFKKGLNTLSGSQAEFFVRYRSGYALGDISRMDMQKIFINGLYNTAKRLDADKLFRVFKSISGNLIQNVSPTDIFIMLLNNSLKLQDVDITYLTLPGKSVYENCISYYVLNRSSCEYIAEKHLFSYGRKFDINEMFKNNLSASICEVYYSTDIHCKEYGMNELNSINVP